MYIQVHDPYDLVSLTSPRPVLPERVVKLVNCIDIYILMISNSAELIPPVKLAERQTYTKHN